MKKNLWERATVAALVLGTAGWLTGGCGNETQEVSTNTLIPFASPFSSVIPAGTIQLSGAQVPAGTQLISVRYTLANGQTATTTGTQSAAGVITAPTPTGFTGTSTVQVTYQGTGGTLLGTQTTTANLVGNNQTVSAQLGAFVGPTPTPTPTPTVQPTPTPAPTATPTPAPTPTPIPPVQGLVGPINVSAGSATNSTLVQVNATTQLTATGNVNGVSTNITNNVTWTSSNATVANVSATGLVRGNASGNSTVTASSGNSTGAINVTVVAPPPPPPADN